MDALIPLFGKIAIIIASNLIHLSVVFMSYHPLFISVINYMQLNLFRQESFRSKKVVVSTALVIQIAKTVTYRFESFEIINIVFNYLFRCNNTTVSTCVEIKKLYYIADSYIYMMRLHPFTYLLFFYISFRKQYRIFNTLLAHVTAHYYNSSF